MIIAEAFAAFSLVSFIATVMLVSIACLDYDDTDLDL